MFVKYSRYYLMVLESMIGLLYDDFCCFCVLLCVVCVFFFFIVFCFMLFYILIFYICLYIVFCWFGKIIWLKFDVL